MVRQIKGSAMIVLALLIGAVIGCQTGAGRMTAVDMEDQKLTLAVGSRINEDPLLKDMPIGVACFSRKITLSGAVNTPEQKMHAATVARSVSGVKKVNNLLLEP